MTQNSNNITPSLVPLWTNDRENLESLYELKRKIMHYVVNNKNKDLFMLIDSWSTQAINIQLEKGLSQNRKEYEESEALNKQWRREIAIEEEEINRYYLIK